MAITLFTAFPGSITYNEVLELIILDRHMDGLKVYYNPSVTCQRINL